MKCKIPEISWHNRDPVLSIDIQPKTNGSSNYYRLASGGTDAHVLIWFMKLTSSGEYGDIELDLAADLTRHQRAVNVVKWSPNGELLASGDDESVVFIWKQKSDSEPLNIVDSTNEQDKEVWITLKVLRGHMEDIYDLSWAPNSLYLVTGSVDNSAIIWDVQKGKSLSILNDHKGFVQGVAWDPKNQYIATLSTDRYMRIFDIQTKKAVYRVSKGTLPVSEDNSLHGKRMRLFHDDTLQTFFRRLTFTPDGKLLLTPAGVTDYDGCTRPLNTTYVFSRYGFRQPAIVLPCPDQYTVAVKCCPLLYKLRPFNKEKNPPVVPLPYRMIFAVATKSSVYFYDTQQKQPFALISNIHYTRLTDISWSNDGRIVVVSSTDGFCSLITFEKDELGEEYENSEAALEAALAQVAKKSKKQKDIEVKSRKPSVEECSVLQKDNMNDQKELHLEKVVEEENEVKTSSANENYTNELVKLDEICKNNRTEKVNPTAKELKTNGQQKNATIIEIKQSVVERGDFQDEKEAKEEKIIIMPVGKTETVMNDSEPKPQFSDKSTTKPIVIKRKLEPMTSTCGENVICTKSKEETTPPKIAAILPAKVIGNEIIIDKEILGSDEKFESPEKKSRPATPITVRRHPRTPSSLPQTPTSMTNILKAPISPNSPSPLPSLTKTNVTLSQDNKAKPIAIRRTPRAIISSPSVVNTTSVVEEAMDAWPLDEKATTESQIENVSEVIKEEGITPLPLSETTCERTEDIRLVYEETNEEAPVKESLPKLSDVEESKRKPSETTTAETSKPKTPVGNKTPRRVALKTISTPKSKKKLLD